MKRFAHGEWIYGVCDDSHGSHWGGTIVVRDSSGRTRAFFGHVCGPKFLEVLMRLSESLEKFYRLEHWEVFSFSEYELP